MNIQVTAEVKWQLRYGKITTTVDSTQAVTDCCSKARKCGYSDVEITQVVKVAGHTFDTGSYTVKL